MNLGLVLKRGRRAWRQLAVLALALCLVTAFFALGPLYVRAMIQSGLQYEVQQIPPARLALTLTSPTEYAPSSWDFVAGQLGALIQPDNGLIRIARSGSAFGGFTYQYGEPTDEFTGRTGAFYHAYAFSNLRQILRLVDGRWPERLAPPDSVERIEGDEQERINKGLGMYSTGEVEAVIGAEVAKQTGFGLGTRFAIGERPETRAVVNVVGIVEAADENNAIWETNRRALVGETVQLSITETFYQMAFIVTEGAYTDWVARATQHRNSDQSNNNFVWMIALDGTAVNADNISDVQTRLTFLINRMTADYPGLISTNPLLRLLDNYVGLVSRTEGPIILLSVAVLALLLYHLVTTVSLALEQQREEWAAMSSRGASTAQLVFLQGITMTLLCVVGFALGPLLAYLILQGLLLGGPLVAATGGVVPIAGIPPTSFMLSGIAALAGLVMLTLPAIPAARRSLSQFKQIVSRPPTRPAWARFGLDVILILVGLGFVGRLLFFVEGDLGQTLNLLFTDPRKLIQIVLDSANRTGGLADPLNLLGPAMLLTGIALLWLRLFPRLMGLFAAVARRINGLTAPLSVWQVQRDPGHYAQLVLLLIGTLALGTAALALGATRDVGTWAAAEQATGGAARITVNGVTAPPADVNWAALPGVSGATILTRYETMQQAGTAQTFLVGVQPESMAQVFPASAEAVNALVGQETEHRSIISRAQRRFEDRAIYPAVISQRLAQVVGRAQRADQLPLSIGQQGQVDLQLPSGVRSVLYFRVVGIVRDFPSLAENQQFIIMQAAHVQEAINANVALLLTARAAPNQIWLSLPDRKPSPELVAALNGQPGLQSLAFAWDRYNELLREPLPAAVAGILFAGFWVSLALSLLDFGFYLAVTARRRSLGFAVLRALGWNINRIWAQLVAEQTALVAPALIVGVILGTALAYVILPFLALFGAVTLTLPATNLLILLIILVTGFGILSFGAAWWLRRLNINQVLRLGEE